MGKGGEGNRKRVELECEADESKPGPNRDGVGRIQPSPVSLSLSPCIRVQFEEDVYLKNTKYKVHIRQ